MSNPDGIKIADEASQQEKYQNQRLPFTVCFLKKKWDK